MSFLELGNPYSKTDPTNKKGKRKARMFQHPQAVQLFPPPNSSPFSPRESHGRNAQALALSWGGLGVGQAFKKARVGLSEGISLFGGVERARPLLWFESE